MINLDMPGVNRSANLPQLVERLIGHGVTGLDVYVDRKAALTVTFPPAEPRPASLLDATVDEVLDYATRAARMRTITEFEPGSGGSAYAHAANELTRQLEAEMLEYVRRAASRIVDELRPAFDEAADVMRAAVAAGIKPTDTRTTLFEAPDEKRTAWLATHAAAKTLDELFTTRQLLSAVAGVLPSLDDMLDRTRYARGNGSGINWALVVTGRPDIGMEAHNPAAPWQRWLKLAQHLQLVDPATITEVDSLRAAGALDSIEAAVAQADAEAPQPSKIVNPGVGVVVNHR